MSFPENGELSPVSARPIRIGFRSWNLHPQSLACCVRYCLWARIEIARTAHPWETAVSRLREIYTTHPDADLHHELEETILPVGDSAPGGTGYVVDSLHSARVACEHSTYQKIVRAAVALGNDTDTTACLAGGIAGIRHGKAGIPTEWLEVFRGSELLLPLLNRIRPNSR